MSRRKIGTMEERRQRAEANEPKYFCKSCAKCSNKFCSFFNRHVEPNFNRCKFHSNYSPHLAKFVPPVNLKEMMLAEEEERRKSA